MSKKEELMKELKHLTDDNLKLQREIHQLQLELSMKGKRVHEFNLQSDEEDAEDITCELDYKNEKRLLQLSTQFTGIKFIQLTQFDLDMKIQVYCGIGEAENIRFDFQFEIEEHCIFKSIIIKFQNEALENELGAWKRELIRKSDFMHLMTGISRYSELLTQMKDILKPLKDSLSNIFEITTSETGCVAKSRKRHEHLDIPVLTLYWKIGWKEIFYTMTDSFTFEIPDVELFTEQQRKMWNKFSKKMSYSHADISRLWIALCDTPEIAG